jgi:glycosyltransferase involved in cell wall biosynthesis
MAEERAVLYHATEHLLPRLTAPAVLTVHDLIFERYPQHHTRRNRLFLHAAMPLFVRAASAIIAVSHHTRRDLVALYGADEAKIHVVYEGVDARFQPAGAAEVARVRQAYSPDRPYLLMVGTLEPRKNHAAALQALARLKAGGFSHRLLLVGGQGWLFDPIRRQIDQLDLAGDVHFAGYVPDADLPPLYTGAACVLVPSLYEGFGFPVLEALACAAPVVCSNASSLPEVAGDAALLVAPEDHEGLAAAVHLLLDQPQVAAALAEAGRRQAGHFRWDACARETAAVYESVV